MKIQCDKRKYLHAYLGTYFLADFEKNGLFFDIDLLKTFGTFKTFH